VITIATVADIITSARYDLRDFGGQKFDDDQLVDYMNRIVALLDELLITKQSDFTMTSADVTLSSGEYVATSPTRSNLVVALFYGTEKIIKEPLSDVMYRYQINNEGSVTGKPRYWAYNNNNLLFNVEADDDYTLKAHYHVKTATLDSSSNMPYNDWFNNYLREALVVMASKARDDKVVSVDMQFYELFKRIVDSAVVGRNFIPKTNKLDF
jgi:hypothetical protein